MAALLVYRLLAVIHQVLYIFCVIKKLFHPLRVGDRIESGQVVAVVESMKMQMRLTSPQRGVVETVHELPGQDVCQGDKLVTLRCVNEE